MFEFGTLEYTHENASSPVEREHVVPFIRKSNLFSQYRISPSAQDEIDPEIYLTVDYPEDIDVVCQIIEYFDKTRKLYNYSQKELITLYKSGEIVIKNKHLHSGFDD